MQDGRLILGVFRPVNLSPQVVPKRLQVVQVNDLPRLNVLDLNDPSSLGRLPPKPEDEYFPVLQNLLWMCVQIEGSLSGMWNDNRAILLKSV